jgi:Flp pilus assembly protein TadB
MFAATSQLKQRFTRVGAGRTAQVGPLGPLARALLALAAAAILAASLAVIGAPLWLSACVGALAGLRVAAWSLARRRVSATR